MHRLLLVETANNLNLKDTPFLMGLLLCDLLLKRFCVSNLMQNSHLQNVYF